MRIMSRVEALREARAEMERVRAEILAAVAGRPEGELLAGPADAGWSAAESSLVKALSKLERGEPTRVPARAWTYRLPMTPVFWPIKLPAPRLVRPRPRAEVKAAEVLEGLTASRRDLLALADRMGEERFARLVFPHFLLGRFTGVSWFRFIAGHEGKHLKQLRRALSAPKVLRFARAKGAASPPAR